MSNKPNTNNADHHCDINALVRNFKTVLMATSTVDGDPEISYSPFVVVEGRLHVLLSDLSLHTHNLKTNPRASLLFIENEQDALKLHARKRVTYKATVTRIDRETDEWRAVLEAMQNRFGEIMTVLESLPDFHLFSMQTDCAVLVKGFAEAHTVPCEGF